MVVVVAVSIVSNKDADRERETGYYCEEIVRIREIHYL